MFEDVKQRTPEWFAQRKGLVTSSNVGAILGVAPNKTADDVMRDMVREWHGAAPEFTGNIATEHGVSLEPFARQRLGFELKKKVEEVGFKACYQSPWLGASPDGVVGNALVEIKCPFGLYTKWRKAGETPAFKLLKDQPHYYAQVQVAMYCHGYREVYFFQYVHADFGGSKIEKVTLDLPWINENVPKLEAFYKKYLVERDPNACEIHLAPKLVSLNTNKALKMVEEYAELKEAKERADERMKELLAELVVMAKERPAAIGNSKLVKTERSGSVSYAKVVSDHCPDVDLGPYKGKPSVSWSLR